MSEMPNEDKEFWETLSDVVFDALDLSSVCPVRSNIFERRQGVIAIAWESDVWEHTLALVKPIIREAIENHDPKLNSEWAFWLFCENGCNYYAPEDEIKKENRSQNHA